MQKLVICALVLLFLCAPADSGVLHDRVDFTASVRTMKMTGHTTYRIDFSDLYLYHDYYYLANYASELEFPLDAYMTEFAFSVSGRIINDLPWALNLNVGINIDDPGGPMKDSDWLQIPQADFDEKIIYTESEAGLDAGLFDVSLQADVWRATGVRFGVMLGYRYQKMDFDAIGVEGWYLDGDLNKVSFGDYPGEVVLTYEVEYQIPYAGISSEFDIMPGLSAATTVKGSPLVSSRDVDDHVLRNKRGVCDGTGAMVGIDGSLSFAVGRFTSGLSLAIGLGYQYTYISTSGTQTQIWYGDDPATSYDDTGTIAPGIHDELKSSQQGIYLTLSGVF